MKSITPVFLIAIGLLGSTCHAVQQPNVLVFMMDDMGYGDCRAYNPEGKVAMPNLENLAAAGMLFTDAHSPSAVCAPTRYSVLTGNYPWRGRLENGTWLFHQPSQVLPGQETLGHLMKRAGYATAFLGKVHLGGRVYSKRTKKPVSWKFDYTDIDFSRPLEQSPASFGFDYAYELPQGIQGPPYVAFETGMLVGKSEQLKIWEAGKYGNSIITTTGFGSPDWDSSQIGPILTEKALGFIDQHIAENRRSGKRRPFFMHYCSQSCHVPHSPPAELGGTKIKGVTGDPHLDMLLEADVTLGMIIERLRTSSELDNTLILVTSDNGGLSRGKPGRKRGGHDSCAGLRGSKALIWEGGHRVPLIARWGDGTAGDSVITPGSRSNALLGLQDIFATLSDLTGQDLDSNQGLDSESFLPVLTGKEKASVRKTLFVQANDGDGPGQRLMKMVRDGDWKLITTRDQRPLHLFHLADDLIEADDLIKDANQQPRIQRMQTELKRIMDSKRSTTPLHPSGPFVAKFGKRAHTSSNNLKSERGNKVQKSLRSSDKQPIHTMDLFEPQSSLAMKVGSSETGKIEKTGNKWRITGKSPLSVEFVPADSQVWDVSRWRLVGVPMLNNEPGVTIVDGRLNNSKPTSWSRHCVGFGVAPSGETATLGFVFPQDESTYQGPEVFRDQLSKPNGHRMHWRRFYPADVRVLRMEIQSSTGKIDLVIDDPILAWESTPQRDKQLHAMPYLDELGQVRALDWPGKIHNQDELKLALPRELKLAAEAAKSSNLSRFGGWSGGPKLKATGNFRTEKVDGKWWLVDPDGYLFFSVGACLAGGESATLVTQKRREANFFAWFPEENDPLRWPAIKKNGKRELINFPSANYARALGGNWQNLSRAGIHDRMRAWGVNTLGSWSDLKLQQDGRTPYTLIASMWWRPDGHRKFPSPFREDYEEDLRKVLQKFAWAKDDPFFLGLFLGNELEWPDRFTPLVFEMADSETTKQWVLKRLQQKYKTLAELNAAWKQDFTDWNQVLRLKLDAIPQAARKDIEPYYLDFTTAFFSKSKKVISEVLPDKLYLGCRCHRGPNVLGRGAAGHVDVFSVNVYDSQVRSWQVPGDVDLPIIAGEFHIGAADRGVPSPGLSSAWDQRQRGLAFSNYLASALADPRFVGVHWFQWIDQSAAGRSDRENHQCGFVDVTGRAYPEFTQAVSQATSHMYSARVSKETSRLKILEQLISKPPKIDNSTIAEKGKEAARAWKEKFFESHPEADANHDGSLTWPELKAHKAKLDAEKSR